MPRFAVVGYRTTVRKFLFDVDAETEWLAWDKAEDELASMDDIEGDRVDFSEDIDDLEQVED